MLLLGFVTSTWAMNSLSIYSTWWWWWLWSGVGTMNLDNFPLQVFSFFSFFGFPSLIIFICFLISLMYHCTCLTYLHVMRACASNHTAAIRTEGLAAAYIQHYYTIIYRHSLLMSLQTSIAIYNIVTRWNPGNLISITPRSLYNISVFIQYLLWRQNNSTYITFKVYIMQRWVLPR